MTGSELDRREVTGKVICGKVICGKEQAFCHCTLDAGHDGPHVCDDRCGGSWSGEGPTFKVHAWPFMVTGQRDDDARCWDCGHPWDTDCGCLCCCDGEPEIMPQPFDLIDALKKVYGGDDAV